MSETHLDLDELADVLAQDAPNPHLASCAQCSSALTELRAAELAVSAQLAALDLPPLPTDLAARLDAALRDQAVPAVEGASVTTLPVAREGRSAASTRWLAAAAASVLLLGGIGFGITQLSGSDAGSNTSANGGAADSTLAVPGLNLVRNDTGNEYGDRAALTAAVPGLIAGTAASQRAAGAAANSMGAPPAADSMAAPAPKSAASGEPKTESFQMAADPLARLREDAGLANCLLALLPPDDASVQPLALDYGTYKGAPAMVVVLPGAVSGKLDVFIVGPACSQANDSTLFYTSVSAP